MLSKKWDEWLSSGVVGEGRCPGSLRLPGRTVNHLNYACYAAHDRLKFESTLLPPVRWVVVCADDNVLRCELDSA